MEGIVECFLKTVGLHSIIFFLPYSTLASGLNLLKETMQVSLESKDPHVCPIRLLPLCIELSSLNSLETSRSDLHPKKRGILVNIPLENKHILVL